jgi:hypothetical protein
MKNNLNHAKFFLLTAAIMLSAASGGSAQTSAIDGVFQHGQWIVPAESLREAALPIFRKEFMLKSVPEQAVLRVVGLGDYDLKVNGQFVAPTGMKFFRIN